MTDVIPPAPDFIEVPAVVKDQSRVVWYRSEYFGRWDLVVSREEQAKMLGCTPALVSSRRSNYSHEFPRPIVKYGTREWVLESDMKDFVVWLNSQRDAATGKNKGKKVERTVKQKAEAEILRLSRRVTQLEEQKAQLEIRVRGKAVEISRAKSRIQAQESLRDTATR